MISHGSIVARDGSELCPADLQPDFKHDVPHPKPMCFHPSCVHVTKGTQCHSPHVRSQPSTSSRCLDCFGMLNANGRAGHEGVQGTQSAHTKTVSGVGALVFDSLF